jgi:hypothetical protein
MIMAQPTMPLYAVICHGTNQPAITKHNRIAGDIARNIPGAVKG